MSSTLELKKFDSIDFSNLTLEDERRLLEEWNLDRISLEAQRIDDELRQLDQEKTARIRIDLLSLEDAQNWYTPHEIAKEAARRTSIERRRDILNALQELETKRKRLEKKRSETIQRLPIYLVDFEHPNHGFSPEEVRQELLKRDVQRRNTDDFRQSEHALRGDTDTSSRIRADVTATTSRVMALPKRKTPAYTPPSSTFTFAGGSVTAPSANQFSELDRQDGDVAELAAASDTNIVTTKSPRPVQRPHSEAQEAKHLTTTSPRPVQYPQPEAQEAKHLTTEAKSKPNIESSVKDDIRAKNRQKMTAQKAQQAQTVDASKITPVASKPDTQSRWRFGHRSPAKPESPAPERPQGDSSNTAQAGQAQSDDLLQLMREQSIAPTARTPPMTEAINEDAQDDFQQTRPVLSLDTIQDDNSDENL